ncbi:MAG TPA: TetR/AcrR family transcriptional regulator [Thermomicrobiaceae bacterium]|nr:TetR/AcrR family transcriptional regulator [Thermomicrobiaceae bacterium]
MTTGTQPSQESPRAGAKRRQIRDAARQVLVEEGFEAASMDDIAAAASVSKRTLYKYYPGKEALLTGLIYDLSLGRDADVQAGAGKLTFESPAELEAFLFRVACSIVDNHFQPEYLALVRSVIAAAPRYPDLTQRFSDIIIEPGYRFLTAIFERARTSGVISTSNTDAVVRLFMGSLLFYTYTYGLMAVGEPRKPSRQQIAEQVRLLVAAIT